MGRKSTGPYLHRAVVSMGGEKTASQTLGSPECWSLHQDTYHGVSTSCHCRSSFVFSMHVLPLSSSFSPSRKFYKLLDCYEWLHKRSCPLTTVAEELLKDPWHSFVLGDINSLSSLQLLDITTKNNPLKE